MHDLFTQSCAISRKTQEARRNFICVLFQLDKHVSLEKRPARNAKLWRKLRGMIAFLREVVQSFA
jgi:hypothetical protein